MASDFFSTHSLSCSFFLFLFHDSFFTFHVCAFPFFTLSTPPLSSALNHSLLSSFSCLHFIKHIKNVICGDKCATVFLPRMIGIHSSCWSSVGGQTGSHNCVCVCVHAHRRWISSSDCMNVFKAQREQETLWGVRVVVCVCVCCVTCTYHTAYRSRSRMCTSSRSLSSPAWVRWDVRGELWPWQEIGGSSDARLHQRCVAPVRPRRAHIVMGWDTLTLCVWECVFVSHSRSFWQISQTIKWIFFSFWTLVPFCTHPVSFSELAAKHSSGFVSIFLVLSFLPHPHPAVITPVTCVLATSWMPSHDVLIS